jgi:hypothetical protein
MQYLIRKEVEKAYRDNATRWFRKYNSNRIMDENVFFWDIPWTPRIVSDLWILMDDRIFWQIDPDSPSQLLKELKLPEEQKDVTFVIKDRNGIFIFVNYEGWKLRHAAPCSPWSSAFGEWAVTPNSWLSFWEYRDVPHYFLDDDKKKRNGETTQEHSARLRGHINNWWTVGGSMPFSRRVLKNGIPDGYYTHIWNVNGRQASHGCIRLPALWAYIMFYERNTWSNIYYRPEYRLS